MDALRDTTTSGNTNLHLVSHDLCPYVQRAIIILAEKNIQHTRTYIDLKNKPAWFRDMSPLGRVPILQAADAVLFESTVICEFLDEITPESLHPEDPVQKARHRAWIEFASSALDAIARLYRAPDATSFEEQRRVLVNKMEWLERHLVDGPYFAGERFHIVDAAYGPMFRYFETFDTIANLQIFAATPKVAAYRRRILERPSVRNAVKPNYSDRLLEFLIERRSHISRLIQYGQDD